MAEAPYGSWKSPISAAMVGGRSSSLLECAWDGDDLLWTETRPEENGRAALVRRCADGRLEEIAGAPWDARTRVYEYGGGSFRALPGGAVVFSSYADGRWWRVDAPGAAPRPITPDAGDALRFSDPALLPGARVAIAIQEDRRAAEPLPRHSLVALDLDGREPPREVASGRDFYFSPRVSPDGRRLAFVAWDLPDMPWDRSELIVGDLAADLTFTERRRIGAGRESVCEPRFSPEGLLVYASDRDGWWQLYREDRDAPLGRRAAEFTQAPWTSDASSWGFESARRIVSARRERGRWKLATIDVDGGALTDLALEYDPGASGGPEAPLTGRRREAEGRPGLDQILDVRAAPGRVAFFGGSAREPWTLVTVDLASGRATALRRSVDLDAIRDHLPDAETIEFPTEDGKTAFAFFYRPRNPAFAAPAGEKPPLVVVSHGGPTSHTFAIARPDIAFFTSRGIAVVDVDYGGSAGWGREYRRRLDGEWGVVDVDDCVNAARFLAARGDVDAKRLAIRGGSAGGFTTLCALTFRDVFAAGASHYGVSDLETLARDTHKFEARYLDRLIGRWPERRERYVERSPIHHTDHLARPVIFFQGLDDKVVPPPQTERMVEALRARKIPVAFLAFEGEQHGFRRAETRTRALEAELWFYSKVLGFPIADAIEPVAIG